MGLFCCFFAAMLPIWAPMCGDVDVTTLSRRSGYIVTSATFGGQTFIGVLDTGATISVLHGGRDFVPPNDVSRKVRTVRSIRGSFSTSVFSSVELAFPGTPSIQASYLMSEDDRFAESSGVPVKYLLIGHESLRSTTIEIDLRRAVVKAADPLTAASATHELKGELAPQLSVDLPGGIRCSPIMDTGSNGWLTIHASHLNQLKDMGHAAFLEELSILTLAGVARVEVYVVRHIDFGGVRFHNVPVVASDVQTMGLGLLQHFRFTLDYPNQRAKFTPLELNRDRMPLDASGLRVVFRENGDFVVRRLVPGYPAEKAGFKVGDRIVDFHGRKPETLWRHEIDDILSKSGETIQLTIERDGEEKVIPLKLQYPFVYPPVWEDPAKLFNPESN